MYTCMRLYMNLFLYNLSLSLFIIYLSVSHVSILSIIYLTSTKSINLSSVHIYHLSIFPSFFLSSIYPYIL